MIEDDRSYYERRAAIETERARQATVACVAQVHSTLARAYLGKLLHPMPDRDDAALTGE